MQRKDLFWFTVGEILVYDQLKPSLCACRAASLWECVARKQERRQPRYRYPEGFTLSPWFSSVPSSQHMGLWETCQIQTRPLCELSGKQTYQASSATWVPSAAAHTIFQFLPDPLTPGVHCVLLTALMPLSPLALNNQKAIVLLCLKLVFLSVHLKPSILIIIWII